MKTRKIIVIALTVILLTMLMNFSASAATQVIQVSDFTSLPWSDGQKYPVNGDTLSVKLYQGAPSTQGTFGIFILDPEITMPKSFDKNVVIDMQLKIAAINPDSYASITFRDANSAGDPWSGNKYALCFETYSGKQRMVIRKNNQYMMKDGNPDLTTGAELTNESTLSTIMTDKQFHRVTISAIDDASGNCVMKVFIDGKKLIECSDTRGVLGVGGLRLCVGVSGELQIKNGAGALPEGAVPADATITKLTIGSPVSSAPASSSSSSKSASSSSTAASSSSEISSDISSDISSGISSEAVSSDTLSSSDSVGEKDGGMTATTIIIIIAIIIILAGGGTALFFILRKKQ